MRSVAELLADARDHARRATRHVGDLSSADFAADAMRCEAVCFCLVVVGEACDAAARQSQNLPPGIPWREIKGMRNILIHEYWNIDPSIVYHVARNEAEPLAKQLEQLIATLA